MKKLLIFMTAITPFSACNNVPSGQVPVNDFSILYHHAEGIKVSGNGNIYMQQQKVATINSNGEIMDAAGKALATYKNDTLYVRGNAKVRIDADGSLYYNTSTYTWDKDGQLLVNNIVTDYSLQPAAYKNHLCASIVFYLAFSATATMHAVDSANKMADTTGK